MSYLLAYNPYNTNLFMRTRSIDPAAQDFIDAAGITGDVQQQAINNLVKGLKADGLWSKMKAVYPFVTDNRNLLGYTEDFGNAAWQKVASTVTTNSITAPNGTLTADTLFGNTTNTFHYTQLVSLTPVVGQTYTSSIYVKRKDYRYIGVSCTNTFAGFRFDFDTLTFGDLNAGTFNLGYEALPNGWYRIYGSRVATSATSDSFSAILYNDSGSASFAGSASLGTYIWGAQLELGSLSTYQPIATTQQAFIASQFKFNLINPVDSDAAFRLVFNGGCTYDKTGATPNGVNGYADTKFVPSSFLTQNSNHLSYYSRTAAAASVAGEIGSVRTISTQSYFHSHLRYTGDIYYMLLASNTIPTVSNTNSQGFFNGSRTNSATIAHFRNGVNLANAASPSVALNSLNVFLGSLNIDGTASNFSTKQTAFSTIGDGLTDDEAAALYYHTQVFQTSLSRQVGSPAYAIPVVTDPNAKLYLSAIGSTTNITFNTAIDTFIKGLKADGIYNKMKAVYPFATDNVNSFSYTEDFSNAYWSVNNATTSINSTTAPNGTNTADTFIEDSTTSFKFIINPASIYGTLGETYTVSIYAKANTLSTIQLTYSSAEFNNNYANFNLSNGSIGTYSGVQPTITSVGNGWYRCSMTNTMTSSGSIRSFVILTNSSSAPRAQSYLGTGKSVYIWGAQLELGSTPSAYQPQLGSAQTYFANQFKYNMVNPQDDDTAFRLVFNGGWTHSPQGALPNGTNAYADTKLIPSSVLTLNSGHLSFYSRTDSQSGIDIGGQNDNQVPYAQMYLASRSSINLLSVAISSTDATRAQSLNTSSLGLFLGSRISSTSLKSFKNGVLQTTNTSASQNIQPNFSLLISALQYSPSPINYSNHQAAFATIGDGLSDTEAANLFIRVETLNQALARQVIVPAVSDPDAQAFLNAAVITDPTQANAVNNLVVGLKADGLWDKMKAIYPFVGGTASTHKYNLKDPRDLDAAYRLVFNGGWTHSSNGALPNGTNGYADTKLNTLSNLTPSNNHVSIYSRTNLNGTIVPLSLNVDMGITNNSTYSFNQIATRLNGNFTYENGSQVPSAAVADSLGFYVGSSISSTSGKAYKNGALLATSTTTQARTMFNNNIYMAATNNITTGTAFYYSARQYAFSSIGDGLNDTEAAALYNSVNTYQVALSRNV
jgi:hypothetical protein